MQRSRNVQAFKPWLERENVDSRRKFPGISFSPTLSVTGVQSLNPCQSFPFRSAQAPPPQSPPPSPPAPLATFARLVLGPHIPPSRFAAAPMQWIISSSFSDFLRRSHTGDSHIGKVRKSTLLHAVEHQLVLLRFSPEK